MERLRREQEKQELLNTEKALEMNKKSPRSKTPPRVEDWKNQSPPRLDTKKSKILASSVQKLRIAAPISAGQSLLSRPYSLVIKTGRSGPTRALIFQERRC